MDAAVIWKRYPRKITILLEGAQREFDGEDGWGLPSNSVA